MKKKFKRNFKQGSSRGSKPQHSLEKIPKEKVTKYLLELEEIYQTTFKFYPEELYINSKQRIYFSTISEDTHKDMKRVNSLGLYLGTLVDSGHIRLSMEGSQLLNQAKDNYVIVKDEYLSSYVSGENLFFEEVDKEVQNNKAPFLMIYDSEFNALGTISKKEKEYLNYISKGRKMNFNRVF